MAELPCEELVAANRKRGYQYQEKNEVFQLSKKALSGGKEVVHSSPFKLNEGELKTSYRFGPLYQRPTFITD